jgi:hypothetical protein
MQREYSKYCIAQCRPRVRKCKQVVTGDNLRSNAGWAAGLCLLAALAYWPVFVQPYLSDDYIQIELGRWYGAAENWGKLLADPLYRCRATSIVVTHWTEQLFGIGPRPYYASMVLLHVLNSLLVWMVGWRVGLGGARSYLAAVVFAVYAGHQEAVMWYAALPELLVFLFCGLFLLAWNGYVRNGGWWRYALAAVCFVLALGSKEAGVVVVPVAALMAWRGGRSIWAAAPLALAAAGYAGLIFAAKSDHLHLNDGTFSLRAPFPLIWARSMGRLFWFWGVLAMAAVYFWRRAELRRLAGPAVWASVALLPFSFLLYMPVVPSRHLYLASGALGFFVVAGLMAARKRFRAHRWVLPALLGCLLVYDATYLWTKKRRQFLARTEATEDLLKLVESTSAPIYVTCFPYGPDVARASIEIVLKRPATMLVWNAEPPAGAVTYCAKHP